MISDIDRGIESGLNYLRIHNKKVGLILNLLGADQEVRTSRTNKERVEGVYRLVEEFYKTSTILYPPRAEVKKTWTPMVDNCKRETNDDGTDLELSIPDK